MLHGYRTYADLPYEEGWSLYHPKNIKKQESQNNNDVTRVKVNIGLGATTAVVGTAHSYIDSYERLLTPYRNKIPNLLEIGIAYGESLEMWYKFFNER